MPVEAQLQVPTTHESLHIGFSPPKGVIWGTTPTFTDLIAEVMTSQSPEGDYLGCNSLTSPFQFPEGDL